MRSGSSLSPLIDQIRAEKKGKHICSQVVDCTIKLIAVFLLLNTTFLYSTRRVIVVVALYLHLLLPPRNSVFGPRTRT